MVPASVSIVKSCLEYDLGVFVPPCEGDWFPAVPHAEKSALVLGQKPPLCSDCTWRYTTLRDAWRPLDTCALSVLAAN